MPWLAILSIIMLATGALWGLGYAPVDYKQFNSYRIIYIHVPGSVVAMAGYYVMAISGAIGLIWRMKLAFMAMKSAALVGALLTFISLVSGSIWGRPTWNTWWVWDARIVSVLILFFLYLGVLALQDAYQDQESADKTSAILSLVGMVNIPIIYYSVDWVLTLHQGATLKLAGESSISSSMVYPLLWMIAAFYLLFTTLVLGFTRLEVLKRERKTRWVKELALEKAGGQ
ncbi:MAG: heme ABC transporter permease CcmC [Agarilytica sp.]